jgi:hypothetical protein
MPKETIDPHALDPKERTTRMTLEINVLATLFQPLANKYGPDNIFQYIEKATEVAPVVVQRWLEGSQIPSQGLQTKIISCLTHFRPGKLEAQPLPVSTPVITLEKLKPLPTPNTETHTGNTTLKYLQTAHIDNLLRGLEIDFIPIHTMKDEEKKILRRRLQNYLADTQFPVLKRNKYNRDLAVEFLSDLK